MTPRAAQALLPLLGVVGFLLSTLAIFTVRCVVLGRPHTPDIERRGRSFLGKFFQEWWIWLYGPVERVSLKLGISPDALTVTSAATAGVAAFLMGTGRLSLGGWVYLFGASLDFVDGRIARATGRVSRSGAFLDSTLDRVSELLVFGALAIAFRDRPTLIAALAGAGASVLVSYARARGEALGVGDEAKVGGMQRPERVVVTGLACALSPIADAYGGDGTGARVIGIALAVLAVSATFTAIRRVAAIYSALRRADAPAGHREFRLADVFRLDTSRRRKAVR